MSPDASQAFTLTVHEAPNITSAASTTFAINTFGSFTAAATGYPAPTFTMEGDLPDGVALSEAGVLAGTPTENGIFTFTIAADNGVSPDGTQSFTLTVTEPPTITTANKTTFVVGTEESFTFAADGHPVSTFSATGGLPDGVTLSASGILSGTPAPGTNGVYPLTVTASNGIVPDATQSFTLTIHEAPSITSSASTTFTVGTTGTFTVTATGNPTPTFSTTGDLPTGVQLTSAGTLTGNPSESGVFTFTIAATNGVGQAASQPFTLTVNEAPAIISRDATSFDQGAPGTFVVAASGYPLPTFSHTGQLPNGVSLSADGVLDGTPTESGVFTITITATNGIVPNATQTFTLASIAPTITAPADRTVSTDPDKSTAIVRYADPTTTGFVGTVSCSPVSGSAFLLGETVVTCTSSTSSATDTFTVTVKDMQPPTIQKMSDMRMNSTDMNGAKATFVTPTGVDNVDSTVAVSCVKSSGSTFEIGTTLVVCSATDSAGNTGQTTFSITVTVPSIYDIEDVVRISQNMYKAVTGEDSLTMAQAHQVCRDIGASSALGIKRYRENGERKTDVTCRK